MAGFEFESEMFLFLFFFTFSSFGGSRLLVSCVQEAGATWRAATCTVARVGDLVQRTGDGRTGRVLGCRTVERSGGAVCGLHLARGDQKRGFLG
jgi:hypothetical protein